MDDAAILDVFRQLRQPDARGLQRPEVLYERRKMTAWLTRNGFPDVSKHTVDRLMRDEGMAGVIRGRKTTTTIPGKDGKRAGDMLNRAFTAPFPNHSWVKDFIVLRAPAGERPRPQALGHTREELRLAIVTWIERTYHRRRWQAAPGRLTPIEFETILKSQVAPAA